MRNLLTLAVSSLCISCAQVPDAPKFPESVTHEYALFFDKQTPVCIRFKIVSVAPYKIDGDNPEVLPAKSCEGLGGYLPKDRVQIINWTDDVQRWANGKSICPKAVL